MNADARFANVALMPEQKELLIRMVEAARSVPRDKRERFALIDFGGDDALLHVGIPSDDAKVYGGDVQELRRKGFLTVTYGQKGTENYEITPEGYLYYEYLKKSVGESAQRVEHNIRTYLDSDSFSKKYPIAYQKWSEAENLLWGSNSERRFTTIGHLLREAIQAFATALVDKYKPSNVEQEKNKDVARIRSVLNLVRDKLGSTEAPFLDALLVYWGTVSDLIQRQAHGSQREDDKAALVWEDARRVIFQAAVVMFEVDKALSHLS